MRNEFALVEKSRYLLGMGKTKEVIEILLNNNLNEKIQYELINLNRRLNHLEDSSRKGILSYTESQVEANQIVSALVEILFIIENESEFAKPKNVLSDSRLKQKNRAFPRSMFITIGIMIGAILLIIMSKVISNDPKFLPDQYIEVNDGNSRILLNNRINNDNSEVNLVKGILRDQEGKPIFGAYIFIKGEGSARTDKFGRFVIQVSEDSLQDIYHKTLNFIPKQDSIIDTTHVTFTIDKENMIISNMSLLPK